MGEIAEAMLDGTFCCVCGEYLDREPAGYPMLCAGCELDAEHVAEKPGAKPGKAHACPRCGKRFMTLAAVGDHQRVKGHET